MKLQTVDHTTYHNNKNRDMNALPMNSETMAPVGTLMLQRCFAKDAVVDSAGTPGRGNFSHYGQLMPGIDDLLAKILVEADPVLDHPADVGLGEFRVLDHHRQPGAHVVPLSSAGGYCAAAAIACAISGICR
jgi:hypothetical protein